MGDTDANLQPIGNDNGICESGETCTVLEHIGGNQPQMTTSSYTFNGQFITGVTLSRGRCPGRAPGRARRARPRPGRARSDLPRLVLRRRGGCGQP